MKQTLAWLRKNLFSTWYDILLTLACLGGLFWAVRALLAWALTAAQWEVIEANLTLFFAGRYPRESLWRLWAIAGINTMLLGTTWGLVSQARQGVLRWAGAIAAVAIVFSALELSSRLWLLGLLVLLLSGASIGSRFARKITGGWLSVAWLVSVPVALWLLAGGLGLAAVASRDWTSLVLTLLTAIASIGLCFPLGVLLAFGRRSELPVIRWLCTGYIELLRGLPLIGTLFFALVMLPFFLPPGVRVALVPRAIAGLTLFSSAYLAENVRAGLQSVPAGQVEAARALGLNPILIAVWIVLPQALQAALPAMVGQFIALLKNTALLSTVGLVELVGMARSILANADYVGRYAEVYLFVGAIYWVLSYGMSLASKQLEKALAGRD